jgi:hypothetical protein
MLLRRRISLLIRILQYYSFCTYSPSAAFVSAEWCANVVPYAVSPNGSTLGGTAARVTSTPEKGEPSGAARVFAGDVDPGDEVDGGVELECQLAGGSKLVRSCADCSNVRF